MTVAVIDVETTGLSPRTDRIVEVGVVLLDGRGEVEGEFETLVNPARDVGPTGLHGTSASDVVDAPVFSDLARHLRSLLSGRVVVAPNALFDLRFLAREFGRSGLQVSLPRQARVLRPGEKIVFTGAMRRTRDDLEQAARTAGLVPMSSVSKQTSVLVCADPHSQAGKATKARALGVRVISEAVFWDALSVAGSRR